MKRTRTALAVAALAGSIVAIPSPAQAVTGNEAVVNSCLSSRGMYARDVQTNRAVLIYPCGSSQNPDGKEGGAIGMPDVDTVQIVSTTCGRWRTATGSPSGIVGGPYVKELGDTSLRFQIVSRAAPGDGPCPTKLEGVTF